MGAAAVLETPAATPESMKFSANPNFWPDMMRSLVNCSGKFLKLVLRTEICPAIYCLVSDWKENPPNTRFDYQQAKADREEGQEGLCSLKV